MANTSSSTRISATLPFAIVLYAALSVADYGFTLAALSHGAREGNPALAWFIEYGLFDFVKLSLTLLVCCVATQLWERPIARHVLRFGNVLMVGVALYHLAYLFQRMGAG
ncbi:MAG: DUF5658 family protein [Fimbriimonadaceae bacterium]|nr:hypothetical protein [Chthonomonadaceae bacterium]MCO5296035.1 DUF5658 family protein [Fimbriimonadaceae bacterium]